ncbi:GGDEF domain-containing protein, partial [Actinoplanes sp. NPDC051633]|uniref:GGDEF domain-containing protein n=1 Tax=Actinoplanes sp. NPDC051633 TaxID=3155670 RepID=UPI0034372123
AYVLPGIPPLAIIAHLVAVASSRSVRSSARERLLSRAGLAIAQAGNAEATRDEALAAVSRLLDDVPGAVARFIDLDPGARPAPEGGAAGGHVTDISLPIDKQHTMAVRIVSPDPLPDEIGDALSVIAAQVSLALTNAKLTEDLRRRAGHDPLTGLANRRTMEEQLAAGLEISADYTVGLLMLDLDGFKQINDTLGHAVGDALLIGIAERLRQQVRQDDIVARLGGDEFVVVMPDVHDPGDVLTIGHRLLQAIRLPMRIDEHVVTVSASVGMTVNHPGVSLAELLREADEAMYEAKRSGKNQGCAALPLARRAAIADAAGRVGAPLVAAEPS